MRLYLTFLLIIGAAVAEQEHAWEIGNEYHFLVRSRTLTVLDKLAKQFSGILMRGALTIQVKSSDTLQAIVSNTQYAPVHKVLPEGWDSKIDDLEFQGLSLSGKSFEIKFKHGVIRDMLIDQDVPTWEVNLLKSIVSQLQIDTQGENAMASRGTQVPDDNHPFSTFRVMEDSVGGKCEVLYEITPLDEDIIFKKPSGLVPKPNLRGNDHFFDITKTKNYTRCEQRMAYHFGISGKTNWKPGSTDGLLSRSSTSRIVISGKLKNFTVQSSVTTNKISISSEIDDSYSGAVYSRMSLTLDRVSTISTPIPASNDLVSTGNLVYIYNNPFSSQRKPRRPSIIQSSLAARSSERRSNSSIEESDDSSSSSFSSSSIFNSEERDYLQPKPKLNEVPESPLLPYFIGYKGKSIHKSEENYTLVAARLIGQITGDIEYFPVEILEQPFTETMERSTILNRLIRTMDTKQIADVENYLIELFREDNRNKFSNEEDKKLWDQTSWEVFRDAVAHAGTGPALITIKNWIKNKKLEGTEAARVISIIPKVARTPTAEYVKAFFELITDEQVTNQKFLNTTAPLAFAELARKSNRSSTYYPVYSFGRMVSKHDNALFETYIPYMAGQLRKAISEGDSLRIQTYIMALGNFGHPKILSVFEPYLEGTSVSKFQRLMMVISFSRLAESFPRIARSVAYKIYVNVMEAYELRCAAVYVIMKTNPPLSMLERMAEFTNQDESKHVNSAVKTSIDALANLKPPALQDLANKARVARKLLSPQNYSTGYSHGIFQETMIASLNLAQLNVLQILGSDDSDILKGVFLGINQSYGGFNLPPAGLLFILSNIRQVQDLWYQITMVPNNEYRTALFIKEIIEKLDIKPEDPEQFEGNIFMESMFGLVFHPFDNHTVQEELVTLAQSVKEPRSFKTRNINHLDNYDATLGFPTESGLPFVYTLRTPKLTRVSGGLSHNITKDSQEVTVAGHIILNEKIQSRIGFVTPFEHRHYIAGIDTNTQIFIPAGLTIKCEPSKQRFELKIRPNEYYRYGTGHIAIHHSVVPYTARHDILDFQSVVLSNDTRLVHTKEPDEVEFSMGSALFAVKGDDLKGDSEAYPKMKVEPSSVIMRVFSSDVGARYRRIDMFLYLASTGQVNITFNSVKFDVDSSDDQQTKATIPAIVDKRPDSEARRRQFLKEVSKYINSANAQSMDIGFSSPDSEQVLTVAIADRKDIKVGEKLQAAGRSILFYWNIQSPNDGKVFLEVCAAGQMRSSPRIHLNFDKVVEQIPKDEFDAELQFGSWLSTNGAKMKIKGNWTRSDDVKKILMKSEIVEKCRQEMKTGNKGLLACQKASALIGQKDHLMMSIAMDSTGFNRDANNAIASISSITHALSSKNGKSVAIMRSENTKENTVDMEIKKSPDNSDAEISLHSSEMGVKFSLTDIYEENTISSMNKKEEYREVSCTLDKTHVVTFDGNVYPLKLGKCWHVMMTIYPKRNPNNPKESLFIPTNLRVLVMAREMDDGSKQIRMFLDDHEIRLEKSDVRLEITTVPQNQTQDDIGDAYELYELPDGSIRVFSDKYEIDAFYDGERIQLEVSDEYRSAVRGLCGNYDMRSDNDFIIPKNCILTKPEEFAATYALTEDSCEGPALENKRKAEQSTCLNRSPRPSDVISDREAGRSPTKNRGWGYH